MSVIPSASGSRRRTRAVVQATRVSSTTSPSPWEHLSATRTSVRPLSSTSRLELTRLAVLHGKIDEVYAHLDSIYSKTRRGQEKKKRIDIQDAISYYDDPEKFDINAEIVLPRRGAGKGKNRVDENDETDEEEDADEMVEVDQVEEVIRRVFDEGYAQADKDDEEMEFEDEEAEDGVAVDQVTKGGRKGAGPIAGTSGKRREATSEKEQRVGAVKKAKVDSKGKGKAVVVSAGGRVVKRKK